MESGAGNRTGREVRKRLHRIPDVPGGLSKSSRGRGRLAQSIKQAVEEWDLYEHTFITKCGDNAFVLKLRSLAHDEEINTRTIQQHGDTVSLIGVYGKAPNFQRERLLGYVLLYVGTPIVHMYTWYVAICYSGADDVRRKDPTPLVSDENVRFFKTGIGVYDYLLCYKARAREHDEAGFSDGATHLETADHWKDGL